MRENETLTVKPVKTLLPDQATAYIIVGVISLYFIAFLLLPLAHILKTSFVTEGRINFQNYIEYFGKARIRRSLYNSFYVAGVTTVITTVMAFFVAYAMTRTTIRGKSFYKAVSSLPLMAPSVVQALALIALFGRNGLVTNWLGVKWDIYGPTGIIISEIFYCFPYALLILITTLSAVDSRLNEAAESLGAGPVKVFTKVTIPSARFGIFSAAALCFNLTITDFGNPIVIGGDYNVLATEIYTQVEGMQRFDLGATISVILLVPAVLAFVLNNYFTKRNYSLISGAARPFLRPSTRTQRVVFSAITITIIGSIIIIFWAIFWTSIVDVWGGRAGESKQILKWLTSFSIRHYNFSHRGRSISVVWTSFWISVIVAFFGAWLTLIAGYVVEKRKPAGSQVLYLITVLPAAIPGLVLGLGYILAFVRVNWLYYKASIIILNIIVANFTLGMLSTMTNMKNIDKSIDEASTSLGADLPKSFFRVIFPLSRISFWNNILFFFERSMVTISAVIFLVSPKIQLASISIIHLIDDGFMESACAMSTIVVAIVVCVHIIFLSIFRKKGIRVM
ncbi:MAG: ABC transporter permease subunit [Spirochaetes bacterium]|nr:ABC transporter permease subunit [Spirochaetota bacterium]